MRRLIALCLLLCLGLGACAPSPPPPGPPPGDPAAEAWSRFLANATASRVPAFSATVSLNYAGPKEKHRVVARFWGNLALPIRLDLQAGVGAMLGHWREGPEGFLAVMPSANTAFLARDSLSGMDAFGLSLPLGLKDLAGLLLGDWFQFLPQAYVASQPQGNDAFRYDLDSRRGPFTLVLRDDGVPLSMVSPPGPDGVRWTLLLQDLAAEGFPPLTPQRVKMTSDNGQETALLFVKQLELRPGPYPVADLALAIPPGATVRQQP